MCDVAMKKSDYKLRMREEARQKLRGPQGGVTGSKEYRERIERGRKHMMAKGAIGAGGATHARIAGELEYLINNYTPSNNRRIEELIEKWRKSGDPEYDVGVRVRYRRAVQKHMRESNPI